MRVLCSRACSQMAPHRTRVSQDSVSRTLSRCPRQVGNEIVILSVPAIKFGALSPQHTGSMPHASHPGHPHPCRHGCPRKLLGSIWGGDGTWYKRTGGVQVLPHALTATSSHATAWPAKCNSTTSPDACHSSKCFPVFGPRVLHGPMHGPLPLCSHTNADRHSYETRHADGKKPPTNSTLT